VAPEEEDDLRGIEKAIAARLPRVTLPDFDYNARPQQNLDQRPPRPPRSAPRGARPPFKGDRRGGAILARAEPPVVRRASPLMTGRRTPPPESSPSQPTSPSYAQCAVVNRRLTPTTRSKRSSTPRSK
jgi:ATP-dependent RNA helicase RhlE